MTIADRIRVKNVRVLSDNHYILKTTTFEWRCANGEWQTQHRETYDPHDGRLQRPQSLRGQAGGGKRTGNCRGSDQFRLHGRVNARGAQARAPTPTTINTHV